MARSSNSALLVLFLLLLGSAAVIAALSLDGETESPEEIVVGTPEIRLEEPAAEPSTSASRRAEYLVEPLETDSDEDLSTTVVYPLEVDLELVRRGDFEDAEGLEQAGAGATAALSGRIVGADGKGMRASVTFVAGANEGRLLVCDSTGAFGASDLYPGISIVRVETPTGKAAERETLLREEREQELNIGFGSPANVYGTVEDSKGNPLDGVRVSFDGHRTVTDAEGSFYVPGIASGSALAIFEKPGYAHYRETVPIPRGGVVTKDRLTFRLEPEARLKVSVEGNVGAAGEPARLFLAPIGQQRVNTVRGQRTYPWHLVSPVEIYPGSPVQLESLPAGHVMLSLFRPGALAKPEHVKVRLYEGREVHQVLQLVPGPIVRGKAVRAGGKGVSGVIVRMEAPNRHRATLRVLGKDPDYSQHLVLPHVGAAQQVVRTDASGRFVFTTFPDVARGYYLTAETEDGLWSASRVVRTGQEGEIELELKRSSQSTGTLRIDLTQRFQGLPVEVEVQGSPRDPIELPPGSELVISDLETGSWRLKVDWNDEILLRETIVEVRGSSESRLAVRLPQGAIDGQSPEERRRAGY